MNRWPENFSALPRLLALLLVLLAAPGAADSVAAAEAPAGPDSGAHQHPAADSKAVDSKAVDSKARPEPGPAGLADRVGLTVTEPAQAAIGLQTRRVSRSQLLHRLRALGSISTDPGREIQVHSRINGWIEKLHVSTVGQVVRKGQPLYDLYSPDLLATQEEYVFARSQGERGAALAESALIRLRLWGVAETELRRLRSEQSARRTLTFYAPKAGIVRRQAAVAGRYIGPELELYALSDNAQVWLLLNLYEAELDLVSVGDNVAISLPYAPGRTYRGRISYLYPELDPQTRTAKARVEIDNADRFLRPGMYAHGDIEKTLPAALVVPDDAVLDSGQRQLVFVQTGPTRFEPREIKAGPRSGGQRLIWSGLEEGEAVVISASFLLDAESRLQAALRKNAGAVSGHGEHDQ